MKTKTYLPIFNGFYNTIFEANTENFESENNCTFDDLEFNYNQYEKDVVLECIEFVKENCPFIKSIEFENIVSPKYYNFSNNSVNVTIDVNKTDLRRYINQNKDALDKYLKKRYTSCDGFISYYANSFEGWKVDTNNFKDLDGHYLGSLLDFYFESEGITTENMYYYVNDNIYTDNYCTLLNKDFDDLTEEQQIEIINSGLIDFSFGYNAILKNEAIDKAKMFGTDWQSELLNLNFKFEGSFNRHLELV